MSDADKLEQKIEGGKVPAQHPDSPDREQKPPIEMRAVDNKTPLQKQHDSAPQKESHGTSRASQHFKQDRPPATRAEISIALFTGVLLVCNLFGLGFIYWSTQIANKAATASVDAAAAMNTANEMTKQAAADSKESSAEAIRIAQVAAVASKQAAEATQKLADSAKESAESARSSVDLAEKTAKRQLRAYVVPDPATATITAVDRNNDFTITVILQNSGVTPACDMVQKTNIVIGPYPQKGEFEPLGDYRLWQGASHTSLGARHSATVSQNLRLQMTKEGRDMLQAGKLVVWVYGTAVYKDVYDEPHTTAFNFHSDPTGPFLAGKLWVAEKGNRAD